MAEMVLLQYRRVGPDSRILVPLPQSIILLACEPHELMLAIVSDFHESDAISARNAKETGLEGRCIPDLLALLHLLGHLGCSTAKVHNFSVLQAKESERLSFISERGRDATLVLFLSALYVTSLISV